MSRRVWSVSELVGEVNQLLEQGFAGIWVEGEVTNASASARGHVYFTLKDGLAALDCVMWASRAERLRFELEDGLAVLGRGSLTVYAPRGRFQLVVDDVQPQGVGALQLAFEQLKKRLGAEGLFADERKRPLPALPQRVGVVTSLGGAALRDMLKVLHRFPFLEVVVAGTRVQGDGAADEIAAAVGRLGASGLVDVILLARGGGSLEDLWAFNEEVVARAVVGCPVPVVSGVGHEVDFTIADFVADRRATTPTQAAEIVVASLEAQARRLADATAGVRRDIRRHLELAHARLRGLEGSSGLARVPQRVERLRDRLDRADRLPQLLRGLAARARERLRRLEAGLLRVPGQVAAGGHRRLLASREEQLRQLMAAHLERRRARIEARQLSLDHLGPRQVLRRGYSITVVEGRRTPLKDARAVRRGQVLETTLAEGFLRSVVATGDGPSPAGDADDIDQKGLFDE